MPFRGSVSVHLSTVDKLQNWSYLREDVSFIFPNGRRMKYVQVVRVTPVCILHNHLAWRMCVYTICKALKPRPGDLYYIGGTTVRDATQSTNRLQNLKIDVTLLLINRIFAHPKPHALDDG